MKSVTKRQILSIANDVSKQIMPEVVLIQTEYRMVGGLGAGRRRRRNRELLFNEDQISV